LVEIVAEFLVAKVPSDTTVEIERFGGVTMELDGNAIGGILAQILRADMTHATRTRARLRHAGTVACTTVYLCVPGAIVRCRNCTGIVMVITSVRVRQAAEPDQPRTGRLQPPDCLS
jgi:hypothetical protein